MSGIKSPGRKAVNRSLKGKPAKRPRWVMKNVPEEIECDLTFYRYFCESKELEHSLDPKKQARFTALAELMRERWNEVMNPKPADPAKRLLAKLKASSNVN
jgi:hypothetical protein